MARPAPPAQPARPEAPVIPSYAASFAAQVIKECLAPSATALPLGTKEAKLCAFCDLWRSADEFNVSLCQGSIVLKPVVSRSVHKIALDKSDAIQFDVDSKPFAFNSALW